MADGIFNYTNMVQQHNGLAEFTPSAELTQDFRTKLVALHPADANVLDGELQQWLSMALSSGLNYYFLSRRPQRARNPFKSDNTPSPGFVAAVARYLTPLGDGASSVAQRLCSELADRILRVSRVSGEWGNFYLNDNKIQMSQSAPVIELFSAQPPETASEEDIPKPLVAEHL